MENLTPAQKRGIRIRGRLVQVVLEFPGCTVDEVAEKSNLSISKRQIQRHIFTLLSEGLVRMESGKLYLGTVTIRIFKAQISYICRVGSENFEYLKEHQRRKQRIH